MSVIVPRTCTEIPKDDTGLSDGPVSRPLKDFRDESAYVLLGDPGAGKSTMFDAECTASGAGACFVTARDLVAFDVQAHPEWHGRTLFIDGLDEVRAGSTDVRTPFDAIRQKLDQLGRPRFRLSCREADWLGANDVANLVSVSPDTHVTVLRLDPLTDHDIERILDSHAAVDDAGEFMDLARERGVDGFLRNPQSLDLLVRVVGVSGSWPASRSELFDLACRQMVREHNEEHIAAMQSVVGTPGASGGLTEEALLDAAGRMCTVQLIAGVAGYALTASAESDGFPLVDECTREWDVASPPVTAAGSRLHQLRRALATKLFSAPAPGRFTPVHRHVAEFLAARYLARLIGDNGLNRKNSYGGIPLRRVVAMMTGYDGMVVTELRGLSAWLAAQCRRARGDLIERDPVGVTLYGDPDGLATAEKVALLKSLAESGGALAERLAASLRDPAQSLSAAGSLVAPDTEAAIRDVLTDPRRDDAHQTFVLFVLRALPHGARLPGLNEVLLDVVRGDGWWPGVRRRALDACLHYGRRPDDPGFVGSLTALLADVHSGQVEDPQEELLGTLLAALYPGEMPPSRVWDYLFETESPLFGGCFFRFLTTNVAEQSPDADVAAHLDQLAARQDALRSALDSRGLQHVPLVLLARGLEAHGDQIEMIRLCDWLGARLIADSDGTSSSNETWERIRSWLARRPAIQKAILDEGMKRCVEGDRNDFDLRWFDIERHFYYPDLLHSALPVDFGLWCLNQAETWAAGRPQVARHLLRRAMNVVDTRTGDEGLTRDILESRVQRHTTLGSIYADLQAGDKESERAIERFERDRQRRKNVDEEEHQNKLDHVRAHETALRQNRCPAALLHQLALAYFRLLIDADGGTPIARLQDLFRGDERLTEAALVGLRGAIFRADLPDIDEVLRLQNQNRVHFLALPALASLEELGESAPDELERLDADLTRKALAFHYCTHGLDEPGWFRRILGLRPELVAEVLIRCAGPAIRNGREHVSGLPELVHDLEHAEVARTASLPLLRAFPIRCAARQMTDLGYLLWSALRHAERDALLGLIERKLSRASMDVAQRGHWLAAGLVVSPDTYFDPADAFAAGGELRNRQLFALFENQPLESFPVERLGVPVLKLVIRRAGSTYRPWARAATGEVTEVTPEMSAAERVQWMIQSVAGFPSAKAGEALEALADDPALSHWRAELNRARDDQRVVRRDAAYRHPDVEQVCQTLNDGPPANADDLAALVMDRLEEIRVQIRSGNTDDWRQYWNEDSYGRPTEPKPEKSCRSALLSDLQQRLPEDVDAPPEGQYANEKRADIRVFCHGFQVPVEVKKNNSRDLWSALRHQLIGQYVRDPATDGYGIYLVLWFGQSGEVNRARMPPPPTGALPRSTGELKERLEATLTRDEKRKIAVCVIDVSPGGRGSEPPSVP